MSSSKRTSKDKTEERQSLAKDRQSTVAAQSDFSNPASYLSIYNVRFPANICEHQAPFFVRQPSALPGRGGGAIVVPTEKPGLGLKSSIKKSPRGKAADRVTELPQHPLRLTTTELDVAENTTPRMSISEGKIAKREAKNRFR